MRAAIRRAPGLFQVCTMSALEPLLVTVVEARKLLGGIGNNKFWQLVKAGELELVGSTRKRWVIVESIRSYVERLRQAGAAARRLPPAQIVPPLKAVQP